MMRHAFSERYVDDLGDVRYRCWRCGIAEHWQGARLTCGAIVEHDEGEREEPTSMGSVNKRGHGRYRARLPAEYGHRTVGTFRTIKLARLALARELARLRGGAR